MDYSNEKFDIILLSGQSNAEGSGRGPADEEYAADEDILRMVGSKDRDDANKWILHFPIEINIETPDSSERDDLSLAFANEYKRAGLLEEGRKVLLIHAALGGTSFASGHWGMKDKGYRRMMYMLDCALNMNHENRLVALLWHQGESDVDKNSPEVYHDQLSALFDSVKSRCPDKDLPIITGDFVQDWKSRHLESCIPIVEQIKAVTAEHGGKFIETIGLPSNDMSGAREGDYIHFSRNSLHILGKRYFDAFTSLI